MKSQFNKTKIAVFRGKKVRKIIHDNEWWFSVVDVVGVLTDSENPRDYWYKMKVREKQSSGIELSTFCRQLKLESSDGKSYNTDCANTESIFRIIQSVPSPKAEPFKLWLARVGYERVKEIEDPELGMKRTKAIYKAKGYSDSWTEKRVRGIAVRHELTDEWDKRGAKEQKEYAILTNDIMQGAFNMDVDEYKKYKHLNRENLRDHMVDIELVLTMLGEATTTKLTKDRNSKGFGKLQKDAKEGGEVAGDARRNIEKRGGKKVITKQNFLNKAQNEQLLTE